MELATCSYAGWRTEMGQPVRITLGPPRRPEFTGRKCWLYVAELAPRSWYFHSPHFDQHYVSQLNRLAADIETKLQWLASATEDGWLTLCCFERRIRGPQDCHRRLFAEWYEAGHPGVTVPELDGRPT